MVEAHGDEDGTWLVTSGLAATDRVIRRAAEAREGTVVVPDLDPAPGT
jgi:hypothetical protein